MGAVTGEILAGVDGYGKGIGQKGGCGGCRWLLESGKRRKFQIPDMVCWECQNFCVSYFKKFYELYFNSIFI